MRILELARSPRPLYAEKSYTFTKLRVKGFTNIRKTSSAGQRYAKNSVPSCARENGGQPPGPVYCVPDHITNIEVLGSVTLEHQRGNLNSAIPECVPTGEVSKSGSLSPCRSLERPCHILTA